MFPSSNRLITLMRIDFRQISAMGYFSLFTVALIPLLHTRMGI